LLQGFFDFIRQVSARITFTLVFYAFGTVPSLAEARKMECSCEESSNGRHSARYEYGKSLHSYRGRPNCYSSGY
jgi:hypothetical protein